jgi:hypothetical protein
MHSSAHAGQGWQRREFRVMLDAKDVPKERMSAGR